MDKKTHFNSYKKYQEQPTLFCLTNTLKKYKKFSMKISVKLWKYKSINFKQKLKQNSQ